MAAGIFLLEIEEKRFEMGIIFPTEAILVVQKIIDDFLEDAMKQRMPGLPMKLDFGVLADRVRKAGFIVTPFVATVTLMGEGMDGKAKRLSIVKWENN